MRVVANVQAHEWDEDAEQMYGIAGVTSQGVLLLGLFVEEIVAIVMMIVIVNMTKIVTGGVTVEDDWDEDAEQMYRTASVMLTTSQGVLLSGSFVEVIVAIVIVIVTENMNMTEIVTRGVTAFVFPLVLVAVLAFVVLLVLLLVSVWVLVFVSVPVFLFLSVFVFEAVLVVADAPADCFQRRVDVC